jgi:hypothetical protein
MLNYINKIYFLLSLILYFIFIPKVNDEYLMLHYINILSMFMYFALIYTTYTRKIDKFIKMSLFIKIFIYSIAFVSLYNLTSYFYTDNFFVFSYADARKYHNFGITMSSMSFFDGIDYLLTFWDFSDLGMPVLASLIYTFIQSNLMINFFYIFIGIFTAFGIFSISKNFMSHKYAFLGALSYSISSFVLFFHSTGLKESFMIMLVVLSFDQYYKFINKKYILNLIYGLIFISLILFFRPILIAFILLSIGIGYLIYKRKTISAKIVFILIALLFVLVAPTIFIIINRYLAGGFEFLVASRASQGMVIGSVPFTYAVNILAQAIGPLPTLLHDTNLLITIYAPGLIYRVLIAFPFWLGVIYIYKTKKYKIYPLLLFVLIEMFALALVMEGLELRKAMPHIPFVFIIAFWFLDQYDNKQIVFKRPKRFKQLFKVSLFLLALLIFYWNFR